MNKRLADDLEVSYNTQDEHKVLSLVVVQDFREMKSFNLINDEIDGLYDFLKELYEEEE